MIETFKTGPLDNNVYLIIDEEARRCLIVDPGIESDHILKSLEERDLTLAGVVNTHGHFDHVAGNRLFMSAGETPLYRHRLDEEMAQRADEAGRHFGLTIDASPPASHELRPGEQLLFGAYSFEILHVPGHSPGSVALACSGLLIGGDVLFRGSIGRTDFLGCSLPQLLNSIHTHIFSLPDGTRVLPGHGRETTVGHERHTNHFIARVAG